MPAQGGKIPTKIEFSLMSHSAVMNPVPARAASALDRTLFLLIVAGLLATAAVIWDTTRDRTVNAGDLAPEFSITTEDGRTLTRSNFGGKVLVLNFWASWCAPCREETPSMEQFHRRLKDQGVVLLGISVDKSADKYKAFLKRFGVTFPTSHDPAARVSDSYSTYRYPETYIISREGRVLEKIVGRKNWVDETFIKSIQGLL
jgi:cytochrome c biogenesis protein CcmG, thiol:disulfide interchange protein DsbE